MGNTCYHSPPPNENQFQQPQNLASQKNKKSNLISPPPPTSLSPPPFQNIQFQVPVTVPVSDPFSFQQKLPFQKKIDTLGLEVSPVNSRSRQESSLINSVCFGDNVWGGGGEKLEKAVKDAENLYRDSISNSILQLRNLKNYPDNNNQTTHTTQQKTAHQNSNLNSNINIKLRQTQTLHKLQNNPSLEQECSPLKPQSKQKQSISGDNLGSELINCNGNGDGKRVGLY